MQNLLFSAHGKDGSLDFNGFELAGEYVQSRPLGRQIPPIPGEGRYQPGIWLLLLGSQTSAVLDTLLRSSWYCWEVGKPVGEGAAGVNAQAV
jgi:hypothetical protein